MINPSRKILAIGWALAAIVLTFGTSPSARADIILFTAAADDATLGNPGGVPGTNNTNIPPINPGVVVTPNTALLDGNITTLNGVAYGPFGFGGNAGGNTGWVNVAYTAAVGGDYQLIWEVAGADYKIGSALVFDNVQVNGSTVFGFESGIPAGFTTNGTSGTSGALTVTDSMFNPLPPFNPTEGSSLGFIDISSATNSNTPIYDTSPTDLFIASQLFSGTFHLNAGDTISMDLAFMTNDGAPFFDYGLAALRPVPEPSSIVLLGTGLLAAAWASGRRRSSPARH